VIHTFGAFELDASSYELRAEGVALPLQPKVVELLAYLIAHRTRVVGKQELLSALWPDVRVGESSLFWCVSQARKALGQGRGDQGPLVTVHGRGYRFGSEVASREAGALADGAPEASGPAGPPDDVPARGPIFIGREHPMAVLRRALEWARAEGRGSGFLVVGEAGIGKTSFVEAFGREARKAGTPIWLGRCLEADAAPAFWPWIQILRAAAAGGAADSLAKLLEDLGPRESAPIEPEFMNGRSGGFWVLDRIVQVLAKAAAAAPLLLVLDDLHWADDPSLRLLEVLAGHLADLPILLVATLRDTDAPRDSTAETLARQSRRLARLPLAPFALSEVGEYLRRVTGEAPANATVAAVHERTGGNPLFVEEAAQRMRERPRGEAHALDLGELPSARRFLEARLEHLDGGIRSAVEAASILGERFELPVLAAVLGASMESVADLLDGASEARLVRQGMGIGAYEFAHGLVREAALAGISAPSRRLLHLAAGEALEASGLGPQRVAQLAFHFAEALPTGSASRAARYAEAAAQAASRVFAHEEARAHWTRALEALSFEREPDLGVRCRLLVGLATTERHLGMRSAAREHATQAIALAHSRGLANLVVAAAAVLRRSIVSHLGMDPTAREAIAQALPHLDADRDRVTALSLLAGASPGRLTAASGAASDEALELARPLGGQAMVEALWARTFVLTSPEDAQVLLDTAADLRRFDEGLGQSWWSGEAHYASFCAHRQRGDADAARRSLEELGALAVRFRLPEAQWHHRRLCAQMDFESGSFDKAASTWRALCDDPQFQTLPYVKALDRIQQLSIAIERDERPGARHELYELVSRWSPTVRAETLLLSSLVENGRIRDARERFEALATNGFAAVPRDRVVLACLSSLAETAIALDDRERAAHLEALLRPYAEYLAADLMASSLGSVAYYLALLAAYRGDVPAAATQFATALDRNRTLGLRPRLARTEHAYAQLLARDGSTRGRAMELADAAAHAAEGLGMGPLALAAGTLAASLRAG
jgi:DNA-binding winged helix-turn-helix (wHTH) protein